MEVPNIGTIASEDIYEYKGKRYIIGEENLVSQNTQNIEFLKEFMPLLVYKAIKDSKVDSSSVELSFSISYIYKGLADYFIKELEEIKVNDEIIKPKKVNFFIQGERILANFRLNYPSVKFTNAVIVDLGWFSADIVFCQSGVVTFADTQKVGVVSLARSVKSYIESQFNETFTEFEVDKILQEQKLKIFGREIAFDETIKADIKKLVTRYSDSVVNMIRNNYLNYVKGANTIVIIAGGGANYFVKERTDTKVPNNVELLTDEYANVR
jgi:actin-like ATPase involved in cell morphogenesis